IASRSWPAPATSAPKPCRRLWTGSLIRSSENITSLVFRSVPDPTGGRFSSGRGLIASNLAVSSVNEPIGFRAIRRPQMHRVPLEFFAQAISQIAEMIGFGQRAGVVERGFEEAATIEA